MNSPFLFVRRLVRLLLALLWGPGVLLAGTHDYLNKPEGWFATDEAKTVAAFSPGNPITAAGRRTSI